MKRRRPVWSPVLLRPPPTRSQGQLHEDLVEAADLVLAFAAEVEAGPQPKRAPHFLDLAPRLRQAAARYPAPKRPGQACG